MRPTQNSRSSTSRVASSQRVSRKFLVETAIRSHNFRRSAGGLDDVVEKLHRLSGRLAHDNERLCHLYEVLLPIAAMILACVVGYVGFAINS